MRSDEAVERPVEGLEILCCSSLLPFDPVEGHGEC